MQNLAYYFHRTFSLLRGYGRRNPEDVERTAAHEAGHALIAVLQGMDIDFVTIDMALHPRVKPYQLLDIWDNVTLNGKVCYKQKDIADDTPLSEEQRKEQYQRILDSMVAGAAGEEVAKPSHVAELRGSDRSHAYMSAQELIMPPPIPQPVGVIENITWFHRLAERERAHSTPAHYKIMDHMIADARDQVKATLTFQRTALLALKEKLIAQGILDGETTRHIVLENLVPSPA